MVLGWEVCMWETSLVAEMVAGVHPWKCWCGDWPR